MESGQAEEVFIGIRWDSSYTWCGSEERFWGILSGILCDVMVEGIGLLRDMVYTLGSHEKGEERKESQVGAYRRMSFSVS